MLCSLGGVGLQKSLNTLNFGIVLACSALTMMASNSGVTAERQAFMDLVKHEIDRLNRQATGKGSLSMVFKAGGITV